MLSSKLITTAFCFFILMVGFLGASYAKDILVPIDDYPPFHILPKGGGEPTGEVISVLKAIVQKVNQKGQFDLNVTFTKNTPFKRGLKMMEKGTAHLIGGLLDKDDRRKYMILLEYKPNSNKVFVIRKDWGKDIVQFDDLKGLNIGVVLGYKYFEEFDNELSIHKDPARGLMLTLKKLEKKRYPVVICSESEWQVIAESDSAFVSPFKLATYKYDKPNPVYIGISKASWLGKAPYIEVFQQAVQEMFEKKEFVKIVADFYESYDQSQ